MIDYIKCSEFSPFGNVSIGFPGHDLEDRAETYLFTGVNGTGKSRLLSLITALLGNSENLLTRATSLPSASMRYWSHNRFEIIKMRRDTWPKVITDKPCLAYGPRAYIGDENITAMGSVDDYNINNSLLLDRKNNESANVLQAISNMKIQSALDSSNGNEVSIASQTLKKLEDTISQITGDKFKFIFSAHPSVKLEAQWQGVNMKFNSLPDGLRMIIGTLAHAVITSSQFWEGEKNPTQEEAILLFDEMETHLHPAWQRKILPAFQMLFPKAQIFAATHSPFVISSLNEGFIYKLEPNDYGIAISEPIPASKGDSYITAVEDILGINEWYDPETEELLRQFRNYRDEGIKGDEIQRDKAIDLAQNIAGRSHELAVMMGAEIRQLNKALAS